MRHVVDTTTRDTAVVVRGCAIVVPSLRNGDVFPVCDYRGQLSSEVRDFGIIYVVVAFSSFDVVGLVMLGSVEISSAKTGSFGV